MWHFKPPADKCSQIRDCWIQSYLPNTAENQINKTIRVGSNNWWRHLWLVKSILVANGRKCRESMWWCWQKVHVLSTLFLRAWNFNLHSAHVWKPGLMMKKWDSSLQHLLLFCEYLFLFHNLNPLKSRPPEGNINQQASCWFSKFLYLIWIFSNFNHL